VRADVSTQRENCCQIGLQHLVPIVVWELVRCMSSLYTTAVEKDINLMSIL
jgi:hypothetical protein